MIHLNVDSEQLQAEWLCEGYVFIFLIWLFSSDIAIPILTNHHVDIQPPFAHPARMVLKA
jgi:hypothetical protein